LKETIGIFACLLLFIPVQEGADGKLYSPQEFPPNIAYQRALIFFDGVSLFYHG